MPAGLRTLPWLKAPATFISTSPITNSYLIGVGRYNTAYNGLLRVYLNNRVPVRELRVLSG